MATQTTHDVISGENPGAIAQKYGTTVEALQAANPQFAQFTKDRNYIQAGWKLNLPGAVAPAVTPTGTTPTTPFTLDTSKEPSSSTLTKYTSIDDIKKMLDENTAEVNKTLVPTAEENKLKQQLADIRASQDNINQGVKEYETNLEGEGISSGAISGRSFDIERNVNKTLERMGLQEKNLLTRLGLETEARGVAEKIAENKYGATKDIIEYAAKAQAAIDKQKTDLIASTDKMADNTRQVLSTILTQFKGLDFHKLNSDAQLKLQAMANQLGIPIDVIIKGMEVNKTQQDLDNLKKAQAGVPVTPTVRSGGLVIKESTVAQGQSALDKSRGKDGYANSKLYTDMLDAWKKDGGLEQDFYKKYPPKNYLNPSDRSIPSYIKDMLKKPTEDEPLF